MEKMKKILNGFLFFPCGLRSNVGNTQGKARPPGELATIPTFSSVCLSVKFFSPPLPRCFLVPYRNRIRHGFPLLVGICEKEGKSK